MPTNGLQNRSWSQRSAERRLGRSQRSLRKRPAVTTLKGCSTGACEALGAALLEEPFHLPHAICLSRCDAGCFGWIVLQVEQLIPVRTGCRLPRRLLSAGPVAMLKRRRIFTFDQFPV